MMLKIRNVVCGIVVLGSVVIGGCGKSEEPITTGSATNASPAIAEAPAGAKPKQVDTVPSNGASIPANGIVLTPKNPDDPRYKPGPGIMGGN